MDNADMIFMPRSSASHILMALSVVLWLMSIAVTVLWSCVRSVDIELGACGGHDGRSA